MVMLLRTVYSLGLTAVLSSAVFAQAEASKPETEVKNPNGAGVVRPMKHPSYQELMAPKDSKDDNWHKLKLTDSEGKSFSLDKYRGKLLLINFFFTHCPDVCPPQTAALNTVFNKLGKFEQDSVQFVSITIDPDNDTKEELAKYKKQFTKTTNWTFARSDKATLEALGKHFGALSGDPKRPLDHRARLFLIKDDGNYLLSYEAAPVDIDRMTRDLTDAVRTFIQSKKKS